MGPKGASSGREKRVNMNPMELFAKEFPHLSARFDELVDAQRALPGLEGKTRQLINIAIQIAIQTAVRNPRGVRFHSLPAAVEGFDAAG